MKQLSIKEFAKLANISTQAIYQRVDKDLKHFVKIEDGKKTISDEALELFQSKTNNHAESNNNQSDTLKGLIDSLQRQLEIKDKQIAEKDEQLKNLNNALLNE